MAGTVSDPMDLDAQERLFWMQAGPLKREPEESKSSAPVEREVTKRQRLDTQSKGKGKGHKGKNKGFSKSGPPSLVAAASNSSWQGDYTGGFDEQMAGPWHSTQTGHLGMEGDQEWMTHRMNTLAQLVLRQEQTLASLRQDLVIYLFVRSGREGMVPVLCEAADKWRTLKETEPDKLTYSLKLAMFKQLLISLHQRLSETIKDKEAMERATSLNWVDEKQHWRHLNWSPVQQRLEIDQSLRPIPTEDLLTQLVQVRKAVTEESLLRFKSVKKLSKEVTADWIQFQICVSLRPEGGAIWSTLNQWIGQASWHTLGCRLRRDRPNYDNLAQQVWNQM